MDARSLSISNARHGGQLLERRHREMLPVQCHADRATRRPEIDQPSLGKIINDSTSGGRRDPRLRRELTTGHRLSKTQQHRKHRTTVPRDHIGDRGGEVHVPRIHPMTHQ